MSYCINPQCSNRYNNDDLERCSSCGSILSINERYRIIRPLRALQQNQNTEIFEIDNLGTIKVLKVLTGRRKRLIELFEQEAKLLQEFPDPAIPSIDNYFVYTLDNGRQLHCLVMEKIIGQNLQQWIQQNQAISEVLAIDWLEQLVEILDRVHQAGILHRDIKPSNIMLGDDGKLKLIDFGAARKITDTYVDKLGDGELTRVYSPGYTAPEQVRGKAVYQSDFFALGRTFVFLLTGIYPNELPEDEETERLLWRDRASQISPSFADIVDRLMQSSPELRIQKSAYILEQLKVAKKRSNNPLRANFLPRFSRALILSFAIALLIFGVRYTGLLQPMELAAFDRLMTLRPLESGDSRLLIVTIDEADIKYQEQMSMPIRWSLSDAAFLQLLQKLDRYRPRTVGLDMYRDFAADSQYPELAKRLQQDEKLFGLCKVPAPEDGAPDGNYPSPEIPQARLGFSDFVADEIQVIRRHLIHLTPPPTSPCSVEYAFNFQLAFHYLKKEGFLVGVTPEGELKIYRGKNTKVLRRLENRASGYQNIDAMGYQIMLNYRSLNSPLDIARKVSLRDILQDRISDELAESIADSIVIIGNVAASGKDYWGTPYSYSATSAIEQAPGVILQAQMASQILSAVLDNRPLIWWWSSARELLWIAIWAGMGSTLVWYLRHPLPLGLTTAISILVLFNCCYAILQQGGWIPLIPPLLAFTATQVTIFYLLRSKKFRFLTA